MSTDHSAASAEPTLYDLVDFPGQARADSHPARVAAIGVLRGMRPAAVERCRVLEIGCGDGANLIPMAYQLPAARFVGIDLAARPVARGQRVAAALGLSNLELHVGDVMAVTSDIGEFDFIIAHGFYSWVPEPVRDRLLDVCAQQLAANGIAFISYLAQPGNQLRDVVREFLFRYGSADGEPSARVRRVRALLRMLTSGPKGTDPFQEVARSLAAEIDELSDGAIFHDWLAPINAAMYVTDFVAHATRHGLQFLGEAEFFMMRYEHDPMLTAARAELAQLEARDIVVKEQLLDYLRCRRFRQTLLCRAGVPLADTTPAHVRSLAVFSRLRVVGSPDLTSRDVAEFRSPQDVSVRVDHPVVKAALVRLGEQWPRAIPFGELFAAARAAAHRTDAATEAGDADVLGGVLLACAGAAHAEFSTWIPPLVTRASERPRASAVARDELMRTNTVTTLRHDNLRIHDPLGAALLLLLDGTRDRALLTEQLAALVEAGTIPVPVAVDPAADVRATVRQGLEDSLTGLARSALLEA
jgi:SAM-dependent methyltransferase